NAVLFSIGQAFRRAGSKVLYFAGYKRVSDRYKVEEIEAAADVVVWCCDEAPGFAPSRPQDKAVVDNIVEAMRKYASGALGAQPIPFNEADRLIAIGSDGMMNAVRLARHSVLKPHLKPDHRALGSINSPMQCMMKEICAQCLQLHKDPVTGKESVVFSCFNQDQELDRVDFACLRQRLRQNSVQEKVAALWIDRSLRRLGARAKLFRHAPPPQDRHARPRLARRVRTAPLLPSAGRRRRHAGPYRNPDLGTGLRGADAFPSLYRAPVHHRGR